MDSIAKNALSRSITVWEGKLDRSPYDIELGPASCPLCRIYDGAYIESYRRCLGCPVFEKTGHIACGTTPYRNVVTTRAKAEKAAHLLYAANGHVDDNDRRWNLFKNEPIWKELQEAIQAEVDFLKSLMPKEGE